MRRRDLLSAALAAALATPAKADDLPFGLAVAQGAEARTRRPELYDPSYRVIAYPMGDVPDDRGVCADVVIRAFRAAGVDLQVLVHEDMRRAFAAYPKIWGLKRPDRNIDHRRVPNLEAFLTRRGARLQVSTAPRDYVAGDLVSWRLTGSNLPHIGVVSTRAAPSGRPLIVHNIGAGSKLEDVVFEWPIVGRFRWIG
ncbi:MAG: DUF1287 domain-containing protein [Caulobacterales bacterium]|jgi:hypothetical protein